MLLETTLPAVSTDPIRLVSRAEPPQMDYGYVDKAAATSNMIRKGLEDRERTAEVFDEPAVVGMLAVTGILLFTMMILIVLTVVLCRRLPGSSLGHAPHYHPAPDYKA